MKLRLLGSFAIIFLICAGLIKAQNIPTYRLTATNFHFVNYDSLIFDVYLLNTSYPNVFEYAGGQYFLNFNPNFSNGGTLTFRILETGLESCQPRNPVIINGTLRFTSNVFPGPGLGCEIPHTGTGALVSKLSLRTTTSFLPLDSLHIRWRNMAHGNPVTKLFAYVNGINTDITDSNFHFIDLFTSIQTVETTNPSAFYLSQNYPNPFNPETVISYSILGNSFVMLKVYDINGKDIATLVNEKQNAGSYSVIFNGANYSSGIYYYTLSAGDFKQARKMVLQK